MKKIKYGALVFGCLVLVSLINTFFQIKYSQASTQIGYATVTNYSGNGSYCLQSTTQGQGQTPIYNTYDVAQNGGGCIQSVTIFTADKVQIACAQTNPPTGAYYYAPVLTGPGTFTENCTSIGGSFYTYSVTALNPQTSTSNSTSTKPALISYDYNPSTKIITFYGSNLGTVSSNSYLDFLKVNTIEISNSVGNFISGNSTQLQMNTATAYQSTTGGKVYLSPGLYSVKYGHNGILTNSITVRLPATPPSLTATMNSNTIGKVNLSWSFSGTSDSTFKKFSIERSSDNTGSNFKVIASTTSKTSLTYTDDITTADLAGATTFYRVRADYTDGTHSDYSNTATQNNCVALTGTGPKKIVFVKGNLWNTNASDFLNNVNNIINRGFKKTDPFKTFAVSQNQFSFLVDLKKQDQTVTVEPAYINGSVNNIKTLSSCGSDAFAYDYLFGDDTNVPTSSFAPVSNGVAFVDAIKASSSLTFITTNVHETGHAVAGLHDEYSFYFTKGTTGDIYPPLNNCSLDPNIDYRSSVDHLLYGSISIKSCGYDKNSSGAAYYRPSNVSIIGSGYNDQLNTSANKFNVISCGYVISAILGETVDKDHAQTHWPQCLTMDTTKEDIPATSIPPVINNVVPVSNTSSNTFKIQGSGFTPTNNTIRLIPVPATSLVPTSIPFANIFYIFEYVWNYFGDLFMPINVHGQTSGSTYYDISGIPSTDGVSITFTVPTSVPTGTYKLSMSSLNSTWNNTSNTITVAAYVPPTPTITALTPSSNVTWTLGQIYNVTWTSTNAAQFGGVNVWLVDTTTGGMVLLAGQTPNTGSVQITLQNDAYGNPIPAGTYNLQVRFSRAYMSTAPGQVVIVNPPVSGPAPSNPINKFSPSINNTTSY